MDPLRAKRNIKPFSGENYGTWKLRVRTLLKELKVLSVIDDLSSEAEKAKPEWQDKDDTAKGVIIDYLSDSFIRFATEPNISAKKIFENLDNIYERKSIASEIVARRKLSLFKLEGDITLTDHFARFENIIQEATACGAQFAEPEKISYLLVSLPESYNGIVTALETLSQDNISLDYVKVRLLDYEVKIRGEKKDTSSKVLFAETPAPSGNSFNKNKSHNFKMKKPFSTNNKKIKFRNNFRGKKNNYNNNALKCHFCGRMNHLIKDCHFYKKFKSFEEKKNKNKSVNLASSSDSEQQ